LLTRRASANNNSIMIAPHLIQLIALGAMTLVILVVGAIVVSRYQKVGPNRVLIVSGRLYRMPDGTVRGFRIVKGGGTFVFPVIEKAEVLSLEVFTIEMPKCKGRTANAAPVEADCVAQLKINGDDPSILAAAEHFLSKNEAETKSILKTVLEKHLSATLGSLSWEEISQNPEAWASRMPPAASDDLAKMGVALVGFTIQKVRSG